MRTLLKNGQVIDAASKFQGISDVYIEDGTIAEIGAGLNYDCENVIDCTGLYIIPGMVDMHCHLREPGYEYKETIETGIESAAAGGFTSVACMPNTNPVNDSSEIVKIIKDKASSIGKVNVFPIAAITKGLNSTELTDIVKLKKAGAVAISDDGRPVTNSHLLRMAIQSAKLNNIPVISHCEDLLLVNGGSMNEGKVSELLGLKGNPREAEEVIVARDILIAEHNQGKIHIAHVSTRGSVQLVRDAKKRGVNVTAETCPHYFSLTEEAVIGYNTNAKMNPPLRTNDDVQAIIEGLIDGTIDAIATDHAPHHADEKNIDFALAANGIVGFETALPVAITYLVVPGKITYLDLVEKMCLNPSKILNIDRGTLQKGKIADITIFDPNAEIMVDVNKFRSKGKNSPFDGMKLKGKVCYTIVGGKIYECN